MQHYLSLATAHFLVVSFRLLQAGDLPNPNCGPNWKHLIKSLVRDRFAQQVTQAVLRRYAENDLFLAFINRSGCHGSQLAFLSDTIEEIGVPDGNRLAFAHRLGG